MNDDLNGRQSRDRPKVGEKAKSTRLFVADLRPNLVTSTKNKRPPEGGLLFLLGGEQTKSRSRRRRKGKNAVRYAMAAFSRQGVSSYKVHGTLWTDTCHLDQKNPWKH